MTEIEIDNLKRKTTYELMLHDPKPLLDKIGIEYKEIGHDSYRMNIRGENTPSAFISLKNGLWKYKDFGSASSGNITTLIMDATQKDFKTSLNYALQTLNVPNYLDLALKNPTKQIQIDAKKIEQLQKNNSQKQKSHQISRVTGEYDIATNQLAQEYLKNRGIVKIPSQLKIIAGEYKNSKNEIKKVFGVGVRTQSGGGDLHFLKKIGDLKTFQLGEKDISIFENKNSNKYAIFESKMDWAASFQTIPLDRVNVLIANSTSNANKISSFLKEKNIIDDVMIFNQNDAAGYHFAADIIKKANIKNFKYIKYKSRELRQDINDLVLNGVKIADRIKDGNLKEIENQQHKFRNKKVNIGRADLRSDTKRLQNTQTKSQGRER